MNISLITMGHGNVNALKRTIDNMAQLCNEVVFGDLFIFDEDRRRAKQLTAGDNIQYIPFKFNYIYENGFASILNELAEYAHNDLVIYMNVSEIIETGLNKELINPRYNCYSFNHATDKHVWVRCYNRQEMKWSGLIHEIVVPIIPTDIYRQPKEHLFRMADTEKDMDNPFKAKVFNDVKEIVYWRQLMTLVDRPELSPATHRGWREYAIDQYESMKQRMEVKGNRVKAFETGNLQMYLDDIHTREFDEEHFESSRLINFQGIRRDIL